MRVLLASDDPRAREAIDYFVFRVRREIGAMAAILGGLDGIVFTGGIGEHAAPVRAAICRDMGWLGLELDEGANAAADAAAGPVVSAAGSRVAVRVIATDEESVIGRAAASAVSDRHPHI